MFRLANCLALAGPMPLSMVMGSESFAKPFTSGRFLPIIIKKPLHCNDFLAGCCRSKIKSPPPSPHLPVGTTTHWCFMRNQASGLYCLSVHTDMKKLPPENREGDIFREIRPACSSSESWSSSCGLRCSCAADPSGQPCQRT